MSLKFSPNLNIFFQDLPFPERIKKVSELGFSHAEFWGWWDQDVAEIKRAAESCNIRITAFCTKFISLVDETQRSSYLAGLEQTIEVAGELGCRTLISQVGDELKGVSREKQAKSLVDGLAAATTMLEKSGVTLTIEPLNLLVDHAGYYLASSEEAFDIVRKVASPNVKVLFDVYHQQVTEGNLINNIRSGKEWIGHYHIADHPGRCEIGTGEINYPNVLKAIEESGYTGSIGIELFPKYGSSEDALRPFGTSV